ncbi:uncharacterized protein [Amphiura filiformis]|uniref:uncharacterized protein isoform X4 n=1 Tax=Amphiura filiformis TaxID=82378 RepID=UPI003B20E1D6
MVVSWLKHDWESRRSHAHSILTHVKLGLVPAEMLTKLMDVQILGVDECKQLYDEALKAQASGRPKAELIHKMPGLFATRSTITEIGYRCPRVKVDCAVDSSLWHNIKSSWSNLEPTACGIDKKDQLLYKIKTWDSCIDLEPNPAYVDNAFKQKATAVLGPLKTLTLDDSSKKWHTPNNETSVKKNILREAFTYNMWNSKGRNFICAILAKCYDVASDNVDIVIENTGGGSTKSDATRFLRFNVDKRPVEFTSSSSSDDISPGNRKSQRISRPPHVIETEPIADNHKAFVPDVVMITGDGETVASCHEVLVVEVKSGPLLFGTDRAQLKYMLIPLAIKQGKSLGFLICSKMAITMKAWVQGREMIFGSKTVRFSGKNLDTELADIMTDLNAHICEYVAEKGIKMEKIKK